VETDDETELSPLARVRDAFASGDSDQRVTQSVPDSQAPTAAESRNSLARMDEVVQSFVSSKQFMGAVPVSVWAMFVIIRGESDVCVSVGNRI
jgi:hypothetical protein